MVETLLVRRSEKCEAIQRHDRRLRNSLAVPSLVVPVVRHKQCRSTKIPPRDACGGTLTVPETATVGHHFVDNSCVVMRGGWASQIISGRHAIRHLVSPLQWAVSDSISRGRNRVRVVWYLFSVHLHSALCVCEVGSCYRSCSFDFQASPSGHGKSLIDVCQCGQVHVLSSVGLRQDGCAKSSSDVAFLSVRLFRGNSVTDGCAVGAASTSGGVGRSLLADTSIMAVEARGAVAHQTPVRSGDGAKSPPELGSVCSIFGMLGFFPARFMSSNVDRVVGLVHRLTEPSDWR